MADDDYPWADQLADAIADRGYFGKDNKTILAEALSRDVRNGDDLSRLLDDLGLKRRL